MMDIFARRLYNNMKVFKYYRKNIYVHNFNFNFDPFNLKC